MYLALLDSSRSFETAAARSCRRFAWNLQIPNPSRAMTRKSALEGTLEIGSHERMEHLQAQTTCIHNIYTYIILYYILFYSILLYYRMYINIYFMYKYEHHAKQSFDSKWFRYWILLNHGFNHWFIYFIFRYVWKLLYAYMLGYDIDFGHFQVRPWHSGSALRGTPCTPCFCVEAVELCSASKFSEKTAGHCTQLIAPNNINIQSTINQLSETISWTQRNFDVGRFSQISKMFSSIFDAHILQHSPAVHHLWSALGIWPLLCFLLTTTTWCAWSWTAWRQTWHLAMRQGQCFKKNMWTIVFLRA